MVFSFPLGATSCSWRWKVIHSRGCTLVRFSVLVMPLVCRHPLLSLYRLSDILAQLWTYFCLSVMHMHAFVKTFAPIPRPPATPSQSKCKNKKAQATLHFTSFWLSFPTLGHSHPFLFYCDNCTSISTVMLFSVKLCALQMFKSQSNTTA
uniref:Uncharacterized protein n=1 Tax=Trypanosoma vivax (strain Y486) TaxID=1055687 RepID=G0UAU4_TRYVY|nr:hypothetical protein TVY486_1104150 [Trypanosoma vivax Y486]